MDVPAFRLKQVTFFQRQVMILCQNKNGPCPLIAITNILLLNGRLVISTDLSYISLEEIVQMVAEVIFEENERLRQSHSTDVIQQTFDDILTILPKLAKGLDLNVCFHGVNKFEFTQEISIFDTLQIPLLHGWLYDIHIEELNNIINDKSYNHLIYKLVDYKTLLERLNNQSQQENTSIDSILTTLSIEEQQLYHQGIIIDNFLNESASQLTEVGLVKLYEFMNDRQLAVFFRNNHFSTIFSYNGQLFSLVTDLGYYDQEAIVWELLMNVNGSTDFYTSHFEPVSEFMIKPEQLETPRANPPIEGTVALPRGQVIATSNVLSESLSPLHDTEQPTPTVSTLTTHRTDIDSDMLLAMQLQMEEEKMQQAERSHSQPGSVPNSSRGNPTSHVAPAAVNVQPPVVGVGSGGSSGALGLTQEEMDQQLALMLHYQEMKQNEPQGSNRGQTPASQRQQQFQEPPHSARSQSGTRSHQPTPRSHNPAVVSNAVPNHQNSNKSSSCIIQ